MQYRRLGSSGLQLSALSFGAWVTFGRQVTHDIAGNLIACAFDHGVNYFDNSEAYAAGLAETIMGEVLARLKLPRDAYCVSSKVFFGSVRDPKPTQRGLSRKHVVEACHQALRRLRVDYLDCYFCHNPDPETPIEETVWAMDGLIRQGKILYWGTSEWPAAAIRQAHIVAKANNLCPPTMEQPQYNLLHRDRVEVEYAPLYEHFGMGTTVWSPLASGVLTGKYSNEVPSGSRMTLPDQDCESLREFYRSGDGKTKVTRIAQLCMIASELDVSPAQLAIAWCLTNPHVSTVILGASNLAQLEEDLGALNAIPKLDDEAKRNIDATLR